MMSEQLQPERPLFVYNGESEACKKWADHIQAKHSQVLDFMPDYRAVTIFTDIPSQRFVEKAHIFKKDHQTFTGAGAIFLTLFLIGQWRLLFALYRFLPGFSAVSEWVYQYVVQKPDLCAKIVDWHINPKKRRKAPTYAFSSWLYFRLFGCVSLIVFGSLWVQMPGLIGMEGILPAASQLEWTREQLDSELPWAQVPTLFWLIGTNDTVLHYLCLVGAVFSFFLVVGIVPFVSLFLIGIIYLSFQQVGGVFFGYQWDVLFIEMCFWSLFLVPLRWFHRNGYVHRFEQPFIWLLWLLNGKLLLMSGLVKLWSSDPAWNEYVALNYHFLTQPLPAPTSYYAHFIQPYWLLLATKIALVIQVVMPFFIILRSRYVHYALGFSFIAMQIAIQLTGNYGFFNILSILLCLWLFDDKFWQAIAPSRWFIKYQPDETTYSASTRLYRGAWALVIALSIINFVSALPRFVNEEELPRELGAIVEMIRPFRISNAYGLFENITKERYEIVVEGSYDAEDWLVYEFRWKPDRVDKPLRFAAPHQPRLDWQMWFASLSSCRQNNWFLRFQRELLEGNEIVVKLLSDNPFEDKPPRFIRTTLYRYEFAHPEQRRENGDIWKREALQPYCPTLTLFGGELIPVNR